MSTKAGQLLWNRMHVVLEGGATTVDTGLRQVSLAFENSSINEPPLFGRQPGPGDPNGLASRVQVMPMSPLPNWTNIIHAEPHLGSNGTVEVAFLNGGTTTEINVLFWAPHTDIGPGDADTYVPYSPQQ